MSSGNGPPRLYSVSASQFESAKLLQLHQQAHALGHGQRFVAAYREIMRRLQRDPQVFGEPLYTLPALHLSVRQAAVDKLVVDYAVHEEQKIVLIRGFKVLS
jgi:hypothetical protein